MSAQEIFCMDQQSHLHSPCGKPLRKWRSCGRGCKSYQAYCEEHGGDDRAVREMAHHHYVQHGMSEEIAIRLQIETLK